MVPKKRRLEVKNVNVNLPEDLTIDILSRLPVKSLLRFKSVCKEWCALISSSFFASLHLDRTISNTKRHSTLVHIFDYRTNKFRVFDPATFSEVTQLYPGLNQAGSFGKGLRFVGSHNGLLCLCDSLIEWLWLWNPSIRQFKTVRTPGNTRLKHCSAGFGCLPNGVDGYKVLVVGYLTRKKVRRMQVEVWSANLGSWKKFNVDCNFAPNSIRYSVITVRGVAYWTGYDTEGDRILVASFDMSTEVLQFFPVPEEVEYDYYSYSALIWKENFALAVPTRRITQVWTMENDGVGKRSWSKKFTIELEFINNIFPVGNGKLFLYDWRSAQLILYDMETKTTKNILNKGNQWGQASGTNYYMESLLSGDGFKRLGENAKLMERSRRSCTRLN